MSKSVEAIAQQINEPKRNIVHQTDRPLSNDDAVSSSLVKAVVVEALREHRQVTS